MIRPDDGRVLANIIPQVLQSSPNFNYINFSGWDNNIQEHCVNILFFDSRTGSNILIKTNPALHRLDDIIVDIREKLFDKFTPRDQLHYVNFFCSLLNDSLSFFPELECLEISTQEIKYGCRIVRVSHQPTKLVIEFDFFTKEISFSGLKISMPPNLDNFYNPDYYEPMLKLFEFFYKSCEVANE